MDNQRRERVDGTASSHPTRYRDAGASIVEVVIAIALLSIVIVPVMRAVITSIRASTTATAASEVETALLNAVDRVNRAPADRCDYSQYARAAVLTQGWSGSEVSMQHAYLDLPTDSWLVGPVDNPACPAGVHRDDLIQQVAITITSPDGKVTRTIQVVKSNV